MRRLQKGKRQKRPRKKTEPLAEGILPLRTNGQRDWGALDDDELVIFARGVIERSGVGSRSGLDKADSGLYDILRRRKLLNRIGLERKRRKIRDWSSMSDEEIVDYALRIVEEKGLERRIELKKADGGLHDVLGRRKLLDHIIPESANAGNRDWSSMSDEELVDYACKAVEDGGLKKRSGLRKVDRGLYSVLKRRKLLDKVIPETDYHKRRHWASMGDEEIIEYAQEILDKKNLKGRSRLQKADRALYDVLSKRDLLDRVGLKRKLRDWASKSDDELVEYARGLMEEKGVQGRTGLMMTDNGLYQALGSRGLLDAVGFKRKLRDWASKSDDELVEYADVFMKERGITGSKDLVNADSGLYQVLRKRNLLDRIELDRKRNWKSMSDDDIVEYARGILERKGIKSRNELEKADSGLCGVLRGRGLWDRVGLQAQKRDWASMNDDGLVDYAQEVVDKKGLKGRSGLNKADTGLYQALRKRKLLDAVFLPIEEAIESQQQKEAVQQVVEAMKEFDA